MKSILKLMTTFCLSATSLIPIVTNLDFFKQEQKNDKNDTYEINFRKFLENYQVFKQVGPRYCGPAAVQSVINFLVGTAPSQEELAHRLEAEEGCGSNPFLITEVLNNYIDNFDYQHNVIPQNFGAREHELLVFQGSVTYSLVHNVPPLVLFNGQIPWAPPFSDAHIVPITGIEVDENPALTRYQVAEASLGDNEFSWFTGADLANMFTRGIGSLILSTTRFNFSEVRISIPVNSTSNHGSIHEEIPADRDLVATSSANLLYEAGVSSMSSFKKAKSLSLPSFSVHYLWNHHLHNNVNPETWNPSEFSSEMGWQKDIEDSIFWDDDDEGEAYINLYTNQTLSADMNLKLMYKISGKNTGPRSAPYADLNTGYYWYLKYKD